jgi:hypothetical protein
MIKPYEIDACKLIEKLSRFLFEFSFLCWFRFQALLNVAKQQNFSNDLITEIIKK